MYNLNSKMQDIDGFFLLRRSSLKAQIKNFYPAVFAGRETRDTILLKKILTTDIDQLVSTGEWRAGIGTAIEDMPRSSASSPRRKLSRLIRCGC
jgi:hypothetical protein